MMLESGCGVVQSGGMGFRSEPILAGKDPLIQLAFYG